MHVSQAGICDTLKMFRIDLIQICLLCLYQPIVKQQFALAEETVNPLVKLFRQDDCKGDYLPVNFRLDTFEHYTGWENAVRSAAVQGPWIFYENTYFNTIYEGLSQYVFNQREQCHQIDYGLAGKVSSLQFAGNGQSYKMSSITIYKGVNFQGSFESGQAYTEGEIPNVQLKTQMSLILTGNIPFEIFAEPNFGGGSYCIIPPPSPYLNPLAIEDLWTADIAYDSIRSVRKGCQQEFYLREFFRLISRR